MTFAALNLRNRLVTLEVVEKNKAPKPGNKIQKNERIELISYVA